MRHNDLISLIFLAAVWGSSFLFMRIAVPEFGPLALIELRVGLAALLLLPLAISRGKLPVMMRHWKSILIVSALNATLPFVFYAYAAQSLGAGFLSVSNALAPVWVATVGWFWLKDRLPAIRVAGLIVSMAGIIVLVWNKLSFQSGGTGPAVLAAICAPVFYGVAANWTKRYLTGVDALSNAAGTMVGASLVLLPLAIWSWPDHEVSFEAWRANVLLAFLCTGVAYIVFFKLIANVGPTAAVSVTFLVPVFGLLWGMWFLNEELAPRVLLGTGIILMGTALALGLLRWPGAARAPKSRS